MIQTSSANALNAINDYLKIEYPEGMRNEFNSMEALINFLQKDTLTGKYKEKMFGLGIVDNMRALGALPLDSGLGDSGGLNDKYAISIADLEVGTGAENVTARFDVTKFMNTFSVTDEALLIGTTDGSLYDTVKDNLNRMNMGLKHTQARMTYGGKSGIIGAVKTIVDGPAIAGKVVIKVTCANVNSLLPGMQVMLHKSGTEYIQGKIWQKAAVTLSSDPVLYLLVDEFGSGIADKAALLLLTATDFTVYSRQFRAAAGVKREYQGLNDILIASPTTLFGVDLSVYEQLKPTVEPLADSILTEQKLDEMADHVALHNSDDTMIDMIVSSFAIISTIKQQFYSFKQYDMDSSSADFKMGRKDVVYDGYRFHKDKYSRDANVYMLDTKQIGELLRKDFGWLTAGREGILERRDGTEIYEAIMTKYGDFYLEAWKAHAAFTGAKESAAA